ncbi:hypothetical protein EA472_05875 [Natrarchaeobius oligotrophus]|uniref:Uncharacterized protein n=1 Tax=Natrarchaeobius chitinivorans TaxID=1679083 RepID=A0A3N6PKL0_NATCH|nr:hypothetical protein EA472_05875 [Natrarchaeobius chitinivorans]
MYDKIKFGRRRGRDGVGGDVIRSSERRTPSESRAHHDHFRESIGVGTDRAVWHRSETAACEGRLERKGFFRGRGKQHF